MSCKTDAFSSSFIVQRSEFGGRHAGLLFEDGVEGGLGVEADLFGDGENGVVFEARVGELALGLRNAVGVDEVGEALVEAAVDGLREMLRGNREANGELL